MTLILLALSLSVALCIIAYNLAIYALPFTVGLSAAQFVYGAGAGVMMSGLAAIGTALLSIGLVIAVLGFAKSPILRLIALAIFAMPAAIAGYALVHGVAKNAIDSGVALNLLCGTGGFFIGIAAMINLSALGVSALQEKKKGELCIRSE